MQRFCLANKKVSNPTQQQQHLQIIEETPKVNVPVGKPDEEDIHPDLIKEALEVKPQPPPQ